MRQWATGVTVVASQHDGVRHGMTVSSFTSISLTPPRVLVCLQRGTRTHDIIHKSGTFSITILSQHQQEISDRFAGRLGEDQDRFAGLETFNLLSGAPLLADGLAHLDCRMVASQAIGDHSLIIGEVLATRQPGAGKPLIYFERAYRRLQE
jgi:flavin reductase (DIM6/NTAB) family NADH-FMN oxidoreductase RutF